MAKLANMPRMEIVSGMKGLVDYYVHCGMPCARSWPRSPGHDRAPAVEAQWDAFAYAASHWNSLSPTVQDAYRRMAAGTKASGRDLFTKSYINGDFILEPP